MSIHSFHCLTTLLLLLLLLPFTPSAFSPHASFNSELTGSETEQELFIEILNKNTVSDDQIGVVVISLPRIIKDVGTAKWYPVTVGANQMPKGEIQLIFEFNGVAPDQRPPLQQQASAPALASGAPPLPPRPSLPHSASTPSIQPVYIQQVPMPVQQPPQIVYAVQSQAQQVIYPGGNYMPYGHPAPQMVYAQAPGPYGQAPSPYHPQPQHGFGVAPQSQRPANPAYNAPKKGPSAQPYDERRGSVAAAKYEVVDPPKKK